ncbi:MAG: flagellar protein FlgN [Desulfotomaculum sp.]|nr:flagellar protein FlgN [Desulfotomaculum sp.]
MEPLFFELIKILKQQRDVVKEMIKASGAQNQALRNADTQSLNGAVKQLTLLTQQMAKLDPQREEIQRLLEKQLELKPGAAVSDMLAKAPVNIQLELKELQMELKKDFEKLREINELNKVLTKRALEVNTAVMKIFTPGTGQTYQQSGKIESKEGPAGVVNKTV